MEEVEIYTDGACSGNPGPGGWAAIIKSRGKTKEIYGYESNTTNNRMELTSVIEALKTIKKPSKINIYTDSRYLKDGITLWLEKWLQRGWKTSSGTSVKNQDLWQKLLELSKKHQISWHWIQAHKNHPENEKCDKLAKLAIKSKTSEKRGNL